MEELHKFENVKLFPDEKSVKAQAPRIPLVPAIYKICLILAWDL